MYIYTTFTKITQMHDGMNPSMKKYQCSNHFMKVDIVVNRQYPCQSQVSEYCN